MGKALIRRQLPSCAEALHNGDSAGNSCREAPAAIKAGLGDKMVRQSDAAVVLVELRIEEEGYRRAGMANGETNRAAVTHDIQQCR